MVPALLIAVFIFNRVIYKSNFNPIVLQSPLWLLYYLFLNINIDVYDVYMRDVNSFILLQFIGFSLGGFFCLLFTKTININTRLPVNTLSVERTYNNLLFLYPLVFALLFVSLILLIREGGRISLGSFSDISEIRETLIEDQGKRYGFYGTVQFLISIYLVIYLFVKPRLSLKFICLILFFFVFTLVLNSKGGFLFFISSLIYILLWEKKIKAIVIVYSFLFLVGIFILITAMRFQGNTDPYFLYEILLVYTVTSMPALAIAKTVSSPIAGYFTFRIIYLWLNKIGFSFPVPPVLSEFTATPLGANTYTYLKPYFYDFGMVGVFVIPMLLGFINNFIYYRARRGKLAYVVLMALLLYPLIMQIFDEQYFQWLSNWAYFIIVIVLLTKLDYGRFIKIKHVELS